MDEVGDKGLARPAPSDSVESSMSRLVADSMLALAFFSLKLVLQATHE